MPDPDDRTSIDEETIPKSPLHAYKEGREEDVDADVEKLQSGDPEQVMEETGSDRGGAGGSEANPVSEGADEHARTDAGTASAAGEAGDAGRGAEARSGGDAPDPLGGASEGGRSGEEESVDPESPARAEASRPPRGTPPA
ncbi:MAG: hypothetical protein ACR2HD_06200 [Solirubrobacteraceae bacterium]|nr:MAG: hypothetical protein DLM63_10920 [Solirubrobacterales bacterium]